jgi:exonuclease SbcD
MQIRIAHMSDLHYSPNTLVEADRCFGEAVTEAINAKVHAAVLTGDSTDHGLQAHSPALLALARQIRRLADHCPVLMLQGTFSHEPVGLLAMFALIGAKYPVMIADRLSSFGLTEIGFEPLRPDGHYRFAVHALPTLNKAEVALAAAADVGAASQLAGDLVAQVLRNWAPVNRQLRARGIPSMVISHGTVLNSVSEHGVPMAGVDHEFGVGALFGAEAEAVALGHIHKHQSWGSDAIGVGQTIAYAGSIGRFHHGEDGDKYWLEWTIQPGKSEFTAHPTPARKTIDIFFDGPPDVDVIRQTDCTGAFVRIRYEVDAEYAGTVNRDLIRATLAQAGAADVQIEGKTLVVERVRAAGISQEQSLDAKLTKWASASGNDAIVSSLVEGLNMLTDGSEIDVLMERIARMVEERLSAAPDDAAQPAEEEAPESMTQEMASLF